MKPLDGELNHFRSYQTEQTVYGTVGRQKAGVFRIRSCVDNLPLVVIASTGYGWDHVSVSRGDRCPQWREMEQIRHLFFEPTECVMQLHAPDADYIDGSFPGGKSRFALHLWRPTDVEIPRPPQWMVGYNNKQDAERGHEIADNYMNAYDAARKIAK